MIERSGRIAVSNAIISTCRAHIPIDAPFPCRGPRGILTTDRPGGPLRGMKAAQHLHAMRARYAIAFALAINTSACRRDSGNVTPPRTPPSPAAVLSLPIATPLLLAHPSAPTPTQPATAGVWRTSPLGTSLNVNPSAPNAGDPAVAAGANGATVVAWREAGRVYARRWSDSAWSALGAGPLNVHTDRDARTPSVALEADGRVLVAWREMNSNDQGEIHAARFASGVWQPLGGSISTPVPGQDVDLPVIAVGAPGPVLVWRERLNAGADLQVRRWDGNAWQPMGSAPTLFASAQTTGILSHAITSAVSGEIVIAAVRRAGPVTSFEVRRWDPVRSAFEALAPPSGPTADGDSVRIGLAATHESVYVVASINPGVSDVMRWTAATRTWASVGLPLTTLSAGGSVETLRLAAGPSDSVALLWRDSRMRVARFDGTAWSMLVSELPGEAMQAFAGAIAVDPTGVHYATWLDRSNDGHQIRAAKVERGA